MTASVVDVGIAHDGECGDCSAADTHETLLVVCNWEPVVQGEEVCVGEVRQTRNDVVQVVRHWVREIDALADDFRP